MMSLLGSNLPSLDLHGESSDIARVLVKEFISDNYKLNKKEIIIIHGIGTGVIKEIVHKELKNNVLVSSYKIDPFNIGTTIVYLKDW